MDYLSHRVDPNELKAGDHIYTWRAAYTYAHHGIYVGENKVVHFTAPENDKSGFGWNLPSSYAYLPASCLKSLGPEFSHPKSGESESSSLNLSSCSHCLSLDQNLQASCLSIPDCGFKLADSGVVIYCLNCFIGTRNLYLYRYGVKPVEYFSKVRGGTCTIAQSDPPQEVIHRAMYLLQNNIFGDYHVVRNNCEDFALYCKTGLLIGGMPTTGSSGQVNFVSNAPWKSIITSTLPKFTGSSGQVNFISNARWKSVITSALPKFVCSSSMGVVTVAAVTGLYYYNRYKTDIGVRDDVVKVKVEDMPLFCVVPMKLSVVGDESYIENATNTSNKDLDFVSKAAI